MKTAISIPDALFARIEGLVAAHGMNRSQFFALAASRLADELEADALREAIDRAATVANAEASSTFAISAAGGALRDGADEW